MMKRKLEFPAGDTYSQLAKADTLSLRGAENTFQVRRPCRMPFFTGTLEKDSLALRQWKRIDR